MRQGVRTLRSESRAPAAQAPKGHCRAAPSHAFVGGCAWAKGFCWTRHVLLLGLPFSRYFAATVSITAGGSRSLPCGTEVLPLPLPRPELALPLVAAAGPARAGRSRRTNDGLVRGFLMNLMTAALKYLANDCQPAPPCLALRRQPSSSQTAVFGRIGLFATSWLAELGTEARPLGIISNAVQAMLSHLAAMLADPGLPQVPRSEAVPREGASTAVRAPGCAP